MSGDAADHREGRYVLGFERAVGSHERHQAGSGVGSTVGTSALMPHGLAVVLPLGEHLE